MTRMETNCDIMDFCEKASGCYLFEDSSSAQKSSKCCQKSCYRVDFLQSSPEMGVFVYSRRAMYWVISITTYLSKKDRDGFNVSFTCPV